MTATRKSSHASATLARIARTPDPLLRWVVGVAWDQTPILSAHAPDVCENPF